MIKAPHTVNGSFYGMSYFFDDGRSVYLAHRKLREIYRLKNAWCLDVSTLEKLKESGVEAVGVVCGAGSKKKFWLTDIDDFYKSPHSFPHFGDTRQRGLPLTRFKVNPYATREYISAAAKVR